MAAGYPVAIFLFIFLIFDMLAFNVDRSAFELNVHLCKVFSDDPEAEKDKSAHNEKENDNSGVSGDVNSEAELLDDNEYHIGELLTGYDNCNYRDHALYNSEDYVVTSCVNGVFETCKSWFLTLETPDKNQLRVNILSRNNSEQ